MRLEDALLYVVFDLAAFEAPDVLAAARNAIAEGADIIGLRPGSGGVDRSVLDGVRRICAADDAVLAVWNDLDSASEADCLHLDGAEPTIGEARAVMGFDRLVGVTAASLDDALLAAELGADYIVHAGGVECASVFDRMRGSGVTALYAGGYRDAAEAAEAVGNGVFRICLSIEKAEDVRPGAIAEYARMFGRVV